MTILTGTPDAEAMRGRWGWFVAAGIALVVLGLFVLGNLVSATLVTTLFVGFALLVGGAAQLVAAVVSGGTAGSRILTAIVGLIYLFIGLNIIAEPLRGVVLLTIVISVAMMIEGVVRLVAAFAGQPGHRILLFATGVIDVLLGLWLFSGIPVTGIAIGFFLGIDLLLGGITWIALGWSVRKPPAGAPAAA